MNFSVLDMSAELCAPIFEAAQVGLPGTVFAAEQVLPVGASEGVNRAVNGGVNGGVNRAVNGGVNGKVIPAKAGIHDRRTRWIPAFSGMTDLKDIAFTQAHWGSAPLAPQ